jgi:hypothetical protein
MGTGRAVAAGPPDQPIPPGEPRAELPLTVDLLPSSTCVEALAQDDEPEASAPPSDSAMLEARRRVIAKFAVDPTILINVTAREMPASPDVLDLGRKTTRALERCLSDNVDATIRARCAIMLAALGALRRCPRFKPLSMTGTPA